MAKIDPAILPDPVRETKTFEYELPGGQTLTLTLRKLGSLDAVNIESIAQRVFESVNPVEVAGIKQTLGIDVCQLIGAVAIAQVGPVEDRYDDEELALLMAKCDSLTIGFMEASTWVFSGGEKTGPPDERQTTRD